MPKVSHTTTRSVRIHRTGCLVCIFHRARTNARSGAHRHRAGQELRAGVRSAVVILRLRRDCPDQESEEGQEVEEARR